jgi:hypothetical protein
MAQTSDFTSPSLREALRRARMASAERSGVLVELRTAELARLDLLKERLEPLFKEVPQGVDMFDAAIMPGDPARLFVDVLGFVEMGRDKRTYRFFHDTRYGRKLIAETDQLPKITQAIVDYVAHRIVEREKALVSDLIETAPTAAPEKEAEVYEAKSSLLMLALLALIAGLLAYWGAGALWETAR